MKYAHFLITHFNLPKWSKDKHNVSTQTEEWLEHRFGLFQRYCLPSVASQTSKDFTWILLFYNKTPEKYKNLNRKFENQYSWYKPCYLNDEESSHMVEYINKFITGYIEPDTEFIITTRLDNDDSIAVDFMEDVENFAKKRGATENYAIDPIHGIEYYPKYNLSKNHSYNRTHFSSYVEPISQHIRNIYGSGVHGRADVNYTIYQINKEAMWMEVIHEKNVCNDFCLGALEPLYKRFPADRFAVEPIQGGGI